MNIKHCSLVLFSILMAASCKTAMFGYKSIDINGMIYDFSNRPIPFCDVSLDNKYKSSTDINGRFTLPKVKMGKYIITGSKKGFETHVDEIIINNKEQIIYIRMPSLNQLLELVDEALTKNDFVTAEEILERAYQIDQNNIEMLFYYAALKFRLQKYDTAINFLESAQKLGSKDIYVERLLTILKEMKNAEQAE